MEQANGAQTSAPPPAQTRPVHQVVASIADALKYGRIRGQLALDLKVLCEAARVSPLWDGKKAPAPTVLEACTPQNRMVALTGLQQWANANRFAISSFEVMELEVSKRLLFCGEFRPLVAPNMKFDMVGPTSQVPRR